MCLCSNNGRLIYFSSFFAWFLSASVESAITAIEWTSVAAVNSVAIRISESTETSVSSVATVATKVAASLQFCFILAYGVASFLGKTGSNHRHSQQSLIESVITLEFSTVKMNAENH